MMRIKTQAFEINTGINGELHLLANYHAKVNKSSNKFRLPRGGGRGVIIHIAAMHTNVARYMCSNVSK